MLFKEGPYALPPPPSETSNVDIDPRDVSDVCEGRTIGRTRWKTLDPLGQWCDSLFGMMPGHPSGSSKHEIT